MKVLFFLILPVLVLTNHSWAEEPCLDFINREFNDDIVTQMVNDPGKLIAEPVNNQKQLDELLEGGWDFGASYDIVIANFLRNLSRNFTFDELIKYGNLNGSFGFYREKNLIKFKPINIFPAFQKLERELIFLKKPLSAELIVEVASEANRYIHDGKQFIEKSNLPFKERKKFVFKKGEVSSEVLQRAEKLYGFSHVKNPNGSVTLFYQKKGESPRDYYRLIEKYAERIEKMVSSKEDPLWIIVRAMQDFNLLHPFKEGNGRTARLIGDAIALRLLGTRVHFPRVFYRDFKNSPQVLYNALERSVFMDVILADTWADTESLLSLKKKVHNAWAKPSKEKMRAFFEKYKIFREMKVKKTTKYKDLPFSDFKITNDRQCLIKGQHLPPNQVVYSELPKDVTQYNKTLFFGKPYSGKAEALEGIELLFRYGRNNRGINPKVTLADYIQSSSSGSSGARSGFFGTSKLFDIGKSFSQGWYERPNSNPHSVVFFIDPRESEVFSVADYIIYNNKFKKKIEVEKPNPEIVYDPQNEAIANWEVDDEGLNPKGHWDTPDGFDDVANEMNSLGEAEQEVIFYRRLPPNRVMGALMWDTKTLKAFYFENSNYIPR